VKVMRLFAFLQRKELRVKSTRVAPRVGLIEALGRIEQRGARSFRRAGDGDEGLTRGDHLSFVQQALRLDDLRGEIRKVRRLRRRPPRGRGERTGAAR